MHKMGPKQRGPNQTMIKPADLRSVGFLLRQSARQFNKTQFIILYADLSVLANRKKVSALEIAGKEIITLETIE